MTDEGAYIPKYVLRALLSKSRVRDLVVLYVRNGRPSTSFFFSWNPAFVGSCLQCLVKYIRLSTFQVL